MEKYLIKDDLNIFGIQVKTFPEGIGDVFTELMNRITDAHQRDFYGISYIKDDGSIFYFAAAQENETGEAGKYNCQQYTISKGEYLISPVIGWKNKLSCINDAFHELMQQKNIDKSAPCVEWYKSDEEMWCMIKTKA